MATAQSAASVEAPQRLQRVPSVAFPARESQCCGDSRMGGGAEEPPEEPSSETSPSSGSLISRHVHSLQRSMTQVQTTLQDFRTELDFLLGERNWNLGLLQVPNLIEWTPA